MLRRPCTYRPDNNSPSVDLLIPSSTPDKREVVEEHLGSDVAERPDLRPSVRRSSSVTVAPALAPGDDQLQACVGHPVRVGDIDQTGRLPHVVWAAGDDLEVLAVGQAGHPTRASRGPQTVT
ncbi:hypothetical protein ACFVXQ_22985 [Kitasatospora sp. NPDC058263]